VSDLALTGDVVRLEMRDGTHLECDAVIVATGRRAAYPTPLHDLMSQLDATKHELVVRLLTVADEGGEARYVGYEVELSMDGRLHQFHVIGSASYYVPLDGLSTRPRSCRKVAGRRRWPVRREHAPKLRSHGREIVLYAAWAGVIPTGPLP